MEIPDIPFDPTLGIQLAKSNLVSEGHQVDENLKPYPEQYDIGVGDTCVVAGTKSIVDFDFTVAEVIDPESFAKEYPDWETRLQRSYLLCKWNSGHDPEGDIGWFARVKLVKISREHYDQVHNWILTKSVPAEPPAWLHEYYNEYTDKLSAVSPGRVPTQVTCPKCGGREVQLHAMSVMRIAGPAGEVEHDGEMKFVTQADDHDKGNMDAHLHCLTCGSKKELEPNEWAVIT